MDAVASVLTTQTVVAFCLGACLVGLVTVFVVVIRRRNPGGAVDEAVLDMGPDTTEMYAGLLKNAATIVWNGPVGVFEFDQFGEGTRVLAHAIAESPAFSIAGGGDTLAALDKYGVADRISYVSTGGGAFLEFLEGKTLPAVAVLEERSGCRRQA